MDLIEVKEERLVECTEREQKHFKRISKGFYTDVELSDWVRAKLPLPNTGYAVSDVDLCLYNCRTQNFMFIEVKRKNFECKKNQRTFFAMLHKRMTKSNHIDTWNFKGFHLLTFENTWWTDGKAYLDHRQVTEQEVIKFFSME